MRWTNLIAMVSHPPVPQNSPTLSLSPQRSRHSPRALSATEIALLATGDPPPLPHRRMRDTAIKLTVDTHRKVRLATATDLATTAITRMARRNGVRWRLRKATAARREGIPTGNTANLSRSPVARTNHRRSMLRQDRRCMSPRTRMASITRTIRPPMLVDTVRIREIRRMGIRDMVSLGGQFRAPGEIFDLYLFI